MDRSKLKATIRRFSLALYFLIRLYIHGFLEMLLQQWKPVKCERVASKRCFSGKVVFCTGGTSGIGLSVCKLLCREGARVVAAGPHSIAKKHITEELEWYIGRGQLQFIQLDLSSFKSIHEAVEQFSIKFASLDFLINNAGVMLVPFAETEEKFEHHMGVNFIGHVLLTKLLLSKMNRASVAGNQPHILNVSSSVHKLAFVPLLFSSNMYHQSNLYSPHLAYCHSKLAINLYTECLAQQLTNVTKSPILVHSVHPGVVASSLYDHTFPPLRVIQRYLLAPFLFRTLDEGAIQIINCLSDSKLSSVNGSYVEDGTGSYLSSVTDEEKEKYWKFVGQMIHKVGSSSKIS